MFGRCVNFLVTHFSLLSNIPRCECAPAPSVMPWPKDTARSGLGLPDIAAQNRTDPSRGDVRSAVEMGVLASPTASSTLSMAGGRSGLGTHKAIYPQVLGDAGLAWSSSKLAFSFLIIPSPPSTPNTHISFLPPVFGVSTEHGAMCWTRSLPRESCAGEAHRVSENTDKGLASAVLGPDGSSGVCSLPSPPRG